MERWTRPGIAASRISYSEILVIFVREDWWFPGLEACIALPANWIMINGRTGPNWDSPGLVVVHHIYVACYTIADRYISPTWPLLTFTLKNMKIPVVLPLRNCQALFTVGSFIKGFSFFLIFVGERAPRFIVSHLERRLSVLTGWCGVRPDSYLKSQARPKSDILTCPCSSNRIFAGFRSRYTI